MRVVHTALLALLLPVAQCEYVVDERCWTVMGRDYVTSGVSPPGSLAERMADCIELGITCHAVLCRYNHSCYALTSDYVDSGYSKVHFYLRHPDAIRYLKTCALQDVEFERQEPSITVCKKNSY